MLRASGRWGGGGVVIDIRGGGGEPPATPSARKRKRRPLEGDTEPPPPPRKPCVWPTPWSGRSGRRGRSRRRGGGRGWRCTSGWSSSSTCSGRGRGRRARSARCRCRPSGPGGTFCVPAGSGCLGARVTRSKGGSVWAVPKSSRDGMGTTTSRGACPALVASLPARAERPERREPSLRPLPDSLGVCPPSVPPGGSPCSSGNRGRGLNRRRAWCRTSGDVAYNGTYRRGEVCKAPIENGGANMEQRNKKTKKLDEIRTKLVRIS